MPQPSYKSVGFELTELKELRDAWSFAGYASTFGNVDEGGDVVMRGAFSDTLKLRPKPKLLWAHNQTEPLGVVQSLREDEKGLYGEWKISRTSRGQDAYTLLKDGAVDSMSIGYIPMDFEFTDDGIRKLHAVELLEVSLVAIPMNEEALITAVKERLSEMPFAASFKRLTTLLEHGAAEAKALSDRRAEEKRKLSDAHVSAIDEVIEQAEAWLSQLKALRATDAAPPAPSLGMRSTSVRLEIARRRAAAMGITLERAS